MLRRVVCFVVFPVVFFFTLIYPLTSLLFHSWYLSDLRTADPEAFAIAERIASHPAYTKAKPQFFIDRSFLALASYLAATNSEGKVYVGFRMLSSSKRLYLDVVIAHELGHNYYGKKSSEDLANRFAAKVLGKYRVICALRALGTVDLDQRIKYVENLPDNIQNTSD